jgi:flagellar biosynthesis protein FlhB
VSEDKQFEATARRKQQAREKGQAPRSRDLSAAGVLLLAAFLAPTLFSGIGRHLSSATIYALGHLNEADLSREGLQRAFLGWAGVFFLALAPLLALVIVGSLLLSALQSGMLVSTYPLVPRLDKLNPFNAIKRIFGMQGLVEAAKSLLKVALVGIMAWVVLRTHLTDMLMLGQLEPKQAVSSTAVIAYELVLKTSLTMVILGAADYAYQRFEHNKSLRMTREEVRQESKETEGDPQMRGKRMQRRKELLRDGMNARLAQASVVLTNPTHVAVALYYKQGDTQAPVVVARGQGRLAQRIKFLARRFSVPIKEEPPLARALYAVCPLGAQVPPALFKAVAVILAQLYRDAAQRRQRRRRGRM